jgi:RNA 2',3'-cyclic 3'-phosphodiesterase
MVVHRCFIAIRLEHASQATLQAFLKDIQRRLPGARWVKPTNAHLTLKFLGDVDQDRLERIATIIKLACNGMHCTTLEMRGLGVFPSMKSPRILWLGLAGNLTSLTTTVQQLDEHLEELGWHKEKQTWVPHITLARFDRIANRRTAGRTNDPSRQETRERLLEILEQNAGEKVGTLHVSSVDLMESKLTPSGSIYRPLFVCSLNAN